MRRLVVAAVVAAELAAAPAIAHDDIDPPTTSPSAPAVPAPVSSIEPAARPSPWPFVLIGAGALTIGAGIWVVHRGDTEAAMPACSVNATGRTTCPYGTSSAWQGWAFVALGAQLAIAGAAWRLYDVRRARKSVSLVAGLGSLGVSGSF